MPRSKRKPSAELIDQMLGEASWLLSHAQALADYGRQEEASAEFVRAGSCEEQVACLLEADGQDREAAIHRVSAASCFERLGLHSRAVTFLHAALSVPLPKDYRARVEQQLASDLILARKELNRAFARRARKQASGV
ncbi:MAG TPA: hypothetical protein VNX28_15405 [Gemmataceae bacterium]|jgi:hypothetical protein|nr:hypothetical protein [Gemmataceae bacterium]